MYVVIVIIAESFLVAACCSRHCEKGSTLAELMRMPAVRRVSATGRVTAVGVCRSVIAVRRMPVVAVKRGCMVTKVRGCMMAVMAMMVAMTRRCVVVVLREECMHAVHTVVRGVMALVLCFFVVYVRVA